MLNRKKDKGTVPEPGEPQKKGGKRPQLPGMPQMPKRPPFLGNVVASILIFLILVTLYSVIRGQAGKPEEIPISKLAADMKAGQITKIIVEGDQLDATYTDEKVRRSHKESGAPLTDTLANYGVAPETLGNTAIEVKSPDGVGFWILNLAPFIIPLLLIIFFVWFLSRQVRGAGVQAFTFGQSKARFIDPNDKNQRVLFKDVAGVKEAKEELTEIVDFLKHPKKFIDIGARIPKGVLLMGAAGTGKTLLARAVAGEAGVPFFSVSGSEFVEMFVGVGASVTGDTPVLIRTKEGTKLMPIGEFVDSQYGADETDHVKKVAGVETLGFKQEVSGFFGSRSKDKKFFGGSAWSSVGGVLRHKVNEIYTIKYRGGVLRTTGDHSVFVRERNMVVAKKASELVKGDVLVNLPFKVRGAFVSGVGTTHKVKAHQFQSVNDTAYLDLYEAEHRQAVEAYNYAIVNRSVQTQKAIAATIGASQMSVSEWQRGVRRPQFLNATVVTAGTPTKLEVTEDLMRLLGYYTAEGRTTEYYTQWVFGLHENDLHTDCAALIRSIFHLEPHLDPVPETNSMRISVSSPIVARFFERQCGNGSGKKHIPEILWDMPKQYFLAYLEGYSKGDGYTTQDGKLSMASISHQLIRELAWLASMHGIQAGIREMVAPAGRVIRPGGKPLPETRSWNLIIGKTSNPFGIPVASPNQFKKPIVESVTAEPYGGYVYDLCGCEGEAFFGGEKPMLLHNSRVRDTFRLAKRAAPAIIFIDEIDAVGRVRGTGIGGGNDEREQTLNQILVEMDGFEPAEKVIVMAATNRADVLDPALLRPGRFDRRVMLTLPDRDDREAILKIHSDKKPLGEDVNLRVIAERTPGFSGADLYSLMNEGAILAARETRKKITQYDLIRSIEKVMLGPERKSHLLSIDEKKITAYHEGGHALVASVLPNADPVHKVTIISRGHAGGYTLKLPLEERRLQSRREFLDDIAVALGGFAAEMMIFGDLTTGPSSDLQVSTAIARDMVTKYGMSEAIGPLALEDTGGRLIVGRGSMGERDYSESVSAQIDAEVAKIMNEGRRRAEEVLHNHRKALDAIAERLIETETLEREEFEKLLVANGIMPKKKKEEKAIEQQMKG